MGQGRLKAFGEHGVTRTGGSSERVGQIETGPLHAHLGSSLIGHERVVHDHVHAEGPASLRDFASKLRRISSAHAGNVFPAVAQFTLYKNNDWRIGNFFQQ